MDRGCSIILALKYQHKCESVISVIIRWVESEQWSDDRILDY